MEEFKPQEQNLKEKYNLQVDEDGFLLLGAFGRQELNRQVKSFAELLDGGEGTLQPEMNLGEGLVYTGGSGNYDTMKIHIDSLEEFIKRVKNHFGE